MKLEVVAIIISITTFAASIASPILVAIINNKHQLKKQRVEYYDNHKNEVIENYLRAVGQFLYGDAYEKDDNYGLCCAEIYMYVPKHLWNQVDEIDDSIRKLKTASDYDHHKNLQRVAQEKFLALRKSFSDLGRCA